MRKKPLSIVPSVYTNSENAIASRSGQNLGAQGFDSEIGDRTTFALKLHGAFDHL